MSKLVCTVFDTDTAALNPLDGNEIVQIGTARRASSAASCFGTGRSSNWPIGVAPVHSLRGHQGLYFRSVHHRYSE
ncbi:hypothetical protein [Ottowia testudinis]|uniref:Uncharacterized protein n=1 Tax=Ottowia testudinis TaxID=2816950 RepID=A0A975H447_9BURK|nr:hypothetical protein [Ottowia testudinis]QTD45946.1 hypothetical protein J1M35_03240 [Ottowia testudinis]